MSINDFTHIVRNKDRIKIAYDVLDQVKAGFGVTDTEMNEIQYKLAVILQRIADFELDQTLALLLKKGTDMNEKRRVCRCAVGRYSPENRLDQLVE